MTIVLSHNFSAEFRSELLYYNLCQTLGKEEVDSVLSWPGCQLQPDFLGFVEQYEALATLIPHHWTIVDLGSSIAAQGYYFRNHKRYIAVDEHLCKIFRFPNTEHHCASIYGFIDGETFKELDRDETFAICNFVPSWQTKIVGNAFPNLFVYYPHGEDVRVMKVSSSPL